MLADHATSEEGARRLARFVLVSGLIIHGLIMAQGLLLPCDVSFNPVWPCFVIAAIAAMSRACAKAQTSILALTLNAAFAAGLSGFAFSIVLPFVPPEPGTIPKFEGVDAVIIGCALLVPSGAVLGGLLGIICGTGLFWVRRIRCRTQEPTQTSDGASGGLS